MTEIRNEESVTVAVETLTPILSQWAMPKDFPS